MNNMSTPTQTLPGPSGRTSVKKAIFAGALGNVLEWYDYGIYGYFASILSALFFPVSDPIVGLMMTFLVFGLGFVARPLGGFIFGHYADRMGRRTVLAITVILMGLSTLLMGLLPTYQQIGVAAPIFLTILRLLQGVATGGEWGSCTSFMVEYTTPRNRTFIVSWSQVSTAVGLLMGSFLGAFLTSVLPQEALYSWGWRIPFICGIIVALVGYYVRHNVDETPAFQNKLQTQDVSEQPLLEAVRYYKRELCAVFLIVAGGNVAYWLILSFMTTYISKFLKLPLERGFQINSISLVVFAVGLPVFGWLADRIGRKRVLLAGYVLLIVLGYPLFAMLAKAQGFVQMTAIVCVLTLILAIINGVVMTVVTEIFPTKVRCSAFAISYNVAAALFGGTSMFVATWLIRVTGNVLSVPLYMIGLMVLTFLAAAFLYQEKQSLD